MSVVGLSEMVWDCVAERSCCQSTLGDPKGGSSQTAVWQMSQSLKAELQVAALYRMLPCLLLKDNVKEAYADFRCCLTAIWL